MRSTRRAVLLVASACALALLAVGVPASAGDGVLITFTSGTGDSPGKISVTNASNGSTTSIGVAAKSPASTCAAILADAAPKVGIKAELSGTSVKISSRSAVVKVEGATITKTAL